MPAPQSKPTPTPVDPRSNMYTSEQPHTLPPVTFTKPPSSSNTPSDHNQSQSQSNKNTKGSTKTSRSRADFLKKKINVSVTKDINSYDIVADNSELQGNPFNVSASSMSLNTNALKSINASMNMNKTKRQSTFTVSDGIRNSNSSSINYDVAALNKKYNTSNLNTSGRGSNSGNGSRNGNGSDSSVLQVGGEGFSVKEAEKFYRSVRNDRGNNNKGVSFVDVNIDGVSRHEPNMNSNTKTQKQKQAQHIIPTTPKSITNNNSNAEEEDADKDNTEIKKIRSYLTMLDIYSLHNFIIWRGSTLKNTPEYLSFKRKYTSFGDGDSDGQGETSTSLKSQSQSQDGESESNLTSTGGVTGVWAAVTKIIKTLEKLMSVSKVPICIVNGTSLINLALLDTTRTTDMLTVTDLITCISNKDQVEDIVLNKVSEVGFSLSGMLMVGRKKVGIAVIKAVIVQSWWRMYMASRIYRVMRVRRKCAVVLQGFFRGCLSVVRVRGLMNDKRERDDSRWNDLNAKLRDNWASYTNQSEIQNLRESCLSDDNDDDNTNDAHVNGMHTVIHLPSLSTDEYLRLSTPQYNVLQNQALTRLCSLSNTLSDVIYVSPLPVPNEVMEYYKKILQVGGVSVNVNGGNVKGGKARRRQLTVIVPENAGSGSGFFPRHFTLSSLLYYSPLAMRKIKVLTKGKHCYILPYIPSITEKRLALHLNIPMLCTNDILQSQVFNTRSGAKRVFVEADVNVLTGAHDIYDVDDLIIALTKLIACDLDVAKWWLVCDVDFKGKCKAFFNTKHLKVIQSLKLERRNLIGMHGGDEKVWFTPDIQLLARGKILTELKLVLFNKGVPSDPSTFPTFTAYAKYFVRYGGCIEGYPDERKVLCRPCVNIFIPPNTSPINVNSIVSVIVDDKNGRDLGCSYPIESVHEKAMVGAALAVGGVVRAKGGVGFFSVCFIAYRIDTHTHTDEYSYSYEGNHDDNEKPKKQGSTLRMAGTSIHPHLTPFASTHALVKYICDKDTINPTLRNSKLTRAYVSLDRVYTPALVPSSSSSSSSSSHSQSSSSSLQTQSMSYASFFKGCRTSNISFDIESLTGIMFMLYDRLSCGSLGVISVGENREKAVAGVCRALGFVKGFGDVSVYNSGEEGGEEFVAVVKMFERMKTEIEGERERGGRRRVK